MFISFHTRGKKREHRIFVKFFILLDFFGVFSQMCYKYHVYVINRIEDYSK